jgi:catechol 2,3-dioxygenase-like lactoylglutathione lyase family enzyme
MTEKEAEAVRINLTSVLVDDQDKALRFYTEILGFVKKTDVPVGEARWLTVPERDRHRAGRSADPARGPLGQPDRALPACPYLSTGPSDPDSERS